MSRLNVDSWKNLDPFDLDDFISASNNPPTSDQILSTLPPNQSDNYTSLNKPTNFELDDVLSTKENNMFINLSKKDKAYIVNHTRQFYKGRSFRYAGQWKENVHYLSDEYVTDFVSIDNALFSCIKSNFSSLENKPTDFIRDEHYNIVGINSEYWDFVISGSDNSISYDEIVHVLGYVPGKVEYGTTEEWNQSVGYIPEEGTIIVYYDADTKVVEDKTINIPGIKIGSGNGYVQDLAFINEKERDLLIDHINNGVIHITSAERAKWNNKLNVTDAQEVIEETLIFNRN